jgi:hypothetical protein
MITNKIQYIALELSTALHDKKHFGFYCMIAKKYPEGLIFSTLSKCLQIRNWSKIKNKGSYFTATFFNDLRAIDTDKDNSKIRV